MIKAIHPYFANSNIPNGSLPELIYIELTIRLVEVPTNVSVPPIIAA